MQALSLALCCALPLVLLLAGSRAQRCLRRFPGNDPDCGTVTDICTLDSVNGSPFNNIPFPSDNKYICYRTCYENGVQGDCIATVNFRSGERDVNTYDSNPMYVAMKFSSPRYRRNGAIGNYRKSTICRYHIRCEGTKLLYYSIVGQSMQDRATCSGLPGVCVDKMRLMFPNVGECERCSSMKNPMNANCMDRSGLGNEMMVEFTANRETDLPGFEILANCVEPGFNQNNIPAPGGIGKRHAEQCSSPEGSGPRDLPALPPPADRLQRVLDRYPNASYRVLEGPGDRLTYNNSIIDLVISQRGTEEFRDIISLEVESPLDVRKYFRIAPGAFNGLAQLVIAKNKAFLVQFGLNPNLMPTEEESTASSLLDTAIADAVSDLEQFDVLDELDLLEQAEEFTVATNTSQGSDAGRKKRGIEPGFLEALSMEYGNACNGVLRASACIYQQMVLGRDCMDGY